ncbi:hypothetical protein BH23GEM6_BH23GEM6_09230 [soil metagenome]
MIASWMVYVLAVSCMLAGAAGCAEWAARRWRMATRGAWIAALTGSVGLPAIVYVIAGRRSHLPTSGGEIGEIRLIGDILSIPHGEPSPSVFSLPEWGPVLMVLWIAAPRRELHGTAVPIRETEPNHLAAQTSSRGLRSGVKPVCTRA